MIACDGCGTKKNVRRSFVTLWNGNVVDLCRKCQKPMVEILDRIWFKMPSP